MTTIASALISAAVTLAVCLITNHAQAEKTISLLEYRLNELTDAVKKHNGLIDRVYKLESEAARYDDEFRRVNHRLKELEEDIKGTD